MNQKNFLEPHPVLSHFIIHLFCTWVIKTLDSDLILHMNGLCYVCYAEAGPSSFCSVNSSAYNSDIAIPEYACAIPNSSESVHSLVLGEIFYNKDDEKVVIKALQSSAIL